MVFLRKILNLLLVDVDEDEGAVEFGNCFRTAPMAICFPPGQSKRFPVSRLCAHITLSIWLNRANILPPAHVARLISFWLHNYNLTYILNHATTQGWRKFGFADIFDSASIFWVFLFWFEFALLCDEYELWRSMGKCSKGDNFHFVAAALCVSLRTFMTCARCGKRL